MQGSAPHYYDIPLLGSKGGWRALATKNLYYIMATQHSLLIDRKRSRPDITTTDFDSAQICSWPRFLLIKGTNDERPLYKLSPFAVNKAIVAILGSDPFNIKKLRNGSILVEVDKETQSQKLLKTTKLNLTMDNAIPIDVSPHYSLNTKKGVIRCPDIKDCTDDEILEGLKTEGVIKLDRISVFRDGQRKPTGTFILTFQSQTLPKYIRVGYYRVAVSQFIPNPVRCYKCQKFGHTKFNCRKNEVCTKCGQEDHTDHQECKNEAKCVNCQGKHESNNKECPKWKEEKEIQRIKTERGISYIEAKKQMDIFNSVKTTYAQAAAAIKPVVKTATVETQTEMTWPEGTKQPKKCAVEKQTPKVTKTSSSSQTSASQNDPIKLKISQSKVYLTKQHKGSNDPIKQYNKYDVLSDSDSEMSVEESPITSSQGRSGNKSVNNGTKQK